MEKLTFADFDLPVKILDVLADLNLFEPTPIQEKVSARFFREEM